MDYKAEVMVNKKIIHCSIYKNYSHPNQIVKLIANKMNTKYEYYTIFIMNKFGEIWQYGIEKVKTQYRAWILLNEMRTKNEVIMVYSGNVTIAELIAGGAR